MRAFEEWADRQGLRNDSRTLAYAAWLAATEKNDEILSLLIRYRTETPAGHQPHMIAHQADLAIEMMRATEK
jgi:hypothetical protein